MTVPTSLSDLLNAATEVTVKGETFALRKPTLAEEGAFSKWLKDRARREAVTVEPGMPEDERDRLARMAHRDITEGYYEPLAPGNVAAKQRPDGMAELLFLVMRTDHPGITREKVRKLVEDGIAQEFLRLAALEIDDPKQAGELCVAMGFPRDYLSSSPTSSSESATPPSTGSDGSGSG